MRLLRVFVRAMPSPVPLDLFEAFRSGTVDPAVKDLAKGKAVGLGSEMMGVRYAMLERLRLEGIEESEWDLGRKRRDGLVELLRTSPAGEVVLEIVSCFAGRSLCGKLMVLGSPRRGRCSSLWYRLQPRKKLKASWPPFSSGSIPRRWHLGPATLTA